MSGLAVIILLGRFWRRATWRGALAALVITPAVSLAAMPFVNNPILPATLTGAFALVVVSLVTPAPTRSFDQVAEALNHERESFEGKELP
jgi:SSS family solute:Na+ symporter